MYYTSVFVYYVSTATFRGFWDVSYDISFLFLFRMKEKRKYCLISNLSFIMGPFLCIINAYLCNILGLYLFLVNFSRCFSSDFTFLFSKAYIC